jgi:hypothetical protein
MLAEGVLRSYTRKTIESWRIGPEVRLRAPVLFGEAAEAGRGFVFMPMIVPIEKVVPGSLSGEDVFIPSCSISPYILMHLFCRVRYGAVMMDTFVKPL